MPRALGFDGDSAYAESLEQAVRASEAQKREEQAEAERSRRASMGLPEGEHKSRKDRKKERDADPARKKSVGEKVANFLFNGARSHKAQDWGEGRVGVEDGRVLRKESLGKVNAPAGHGRAEEVVDMPESGRDEVVR